MTEQEEKNNRLLRASFFGDFSDVERCLNDGADVNARDGCGDTPLHNALMNGKWSIAELLLDAGADVSAENAEGLSLIEQAFRAEHAIPNSLFERLKRDHAFDVRHRVKGGWQVIHLAAKSGCTENVRVLLSIGADPNAVKDDGWTPLLLALVNEHFGVAKVLIEAGAKLVLPEDALHAKMVEEVEQ